MNVFGKLMAIIIKSTKKATFKGGFAVYFNLFYLLRINLPFITALPVFSVIL